ncbi:MarR family winged helix-turn-helix transcriptional regulator [Alienimonas californiensis]|uniref:Transcriptional regulator SlyA n=1 Tax=Alienimonas californiensis TaxID=2527989 RepID=A0A517P4U5_9PLAN|nr:MarR family winged helix-turn-helix transcriptional regulator [Alienimonas californiensis]QDT14399.1 transcriptional regulator SlyA [Alienimonas californiensis]
MPPATPNDHAASTSGGHVEHPPVSAAARAAAPPHPPRPVTVPPASLSGKPASPVPAFSRPSGAVTSLPANSPQASYFTGPAVAAVTAGRGAVVSGSPYSSGQYYSGSNASQGERVEHPPVVPFARPAAPAPQAARPAQPAYAARPEGPATIPAEHRFASQPSHAAPTSPTGPREEYAQIAGSIGPTQEVPAPDLSPADAAANRVLDTLMKLGHRVRGVLDARFAGMKMTDARYMALRVVQDSAPEGCTQAKLAAALGQCESSVSTLVERMRTGKLVYRLHPKSDRRKRVLLLTDAGREALEHAEAARAEAAKELCIALSHEERDGLCDALSCLLEGVQQTDADAGRRRKVA